MSILDVACAPSTFAARLFNPLQSLFALAARLYVSWQFLQAGFGKARNWPNTVALFEHYHSAWLTAEQAAMAATSVELFFPTLLVLGFVSRLSALCVMAVNVTAVVAYQQMLLADGSEAALGRHVLWGSLLLFLIIYGPGKLSLDYLLNKARF